MGTLARLNPGKKKEERKKEERFKQVMLSPR